MMGQADITVQKDAIRFQEMKMDRAATLADNAMQNAADARGSRIKAISGMGDSMMQAAGNFAKLGK